MIFTSSNGTTTKLSVAPAAHPVAIASCCVIFFSPESARNCLPQKSFAALCGRARVRVRVRVAHEVARRVRVRREVLAAGGGHAEAARVLARVVHGRVAVALRLGKTGRWRMT